ncbi:MAG: hypothetical protein LBC31_00420 [Treponema sp.]|jgi:hypothetical protein|nr:hypothetical protein [Treponema sp.]
MNLQKILWLALVLTFFAGVQAFTLEIWGTGSIGNIVNEVKDDLGDIDDKPEKFIRGFADASVFSSSGATQRAYGEYKLWAFTIGPMIGFRLPGSSPFNITDEMQNVGDTLEEDGDAKLGVNIQAITGQIGINTSKFLLDRLYLGLRFGFFKLTGMEGFDLKTFQIGVVGNYQLLKGTTAGSGILRWRGVSAGTGFIFQKTDLTYNFTDETYTDGGFTTTPEVEFNMDIKTFVIPLEVNTSVQLLWVLNLNLGLGVDVAFGKNDTTIGADSPVYDPSGANVGTIYVRGGGDMAPTAFNPKIMTNIGFKFGPVILDVPVTYYFGNGFNAGITLGAVW